jgi:hypothetical protein
LTKGEDNKIIIPEQNEETKQRKQENRATNKRSNHTIKKNP